MVWAIFR
jgi:hypothetical protein